MVMPEVKKPVPFQPEWLVNLKIQADGFFL
jgi:hypothetical protein